MPCTGPSYQEACNFANETYDMLIKYLQEKRGIIDPARMSDPDFKFDFFKENYSLAASNLKKAIQDFIWEEACLSF